MPWQGIHPETVRRFLLECEGHHLVSKAYFDATPVYELTKKGTQMVALVIEHVEQFGRVKWEEVASTPDIMELVNLALRLGILEEKRGLLSIITTGCEELPTYYVVAGVIGPHGNFIPLAGLQLPTYIPSPEGELKHVGHGKYVPRNVVKENPWDYFPSIVGGLFPILFGVGCIVASELSKRSG